MNIFTDKVGPLPVWGWGTVLIGGILILRDRKGSPASTATSPNPVVPYPTTGPTGGVFVLPGGDPSNKVAASQLTMPISPAPTPQASSAWGGTHPSLQFPIHFGWGNRTPFNNNGSGLVSSGPVPPIVDKVAPTDGY